MESHDAEFRESGQGWRTRPAEPDTAQRLADTAAGTWGEEAAIWLLTNHGHWIPELERCGLIWEQPMAGGGKATTIRFRRIYPSRTPIIGTGSEWQVLRVAADLAGTPFGSWFAQDLISLDETNRRLVLHAIAWAAGGRAWADQLGLTRDVLEDAARRLLALPTAFDGRLIAATREEIVAIVRDNEASRPAEEV